MTATSLPIAVQLYTLRHLEEPFDDMLADVAAIGYAGVETVDNHGLTADEMRAILDRHQLQVVSSHVGMAALEDKFDEVIAFNRAVDNQMLVIPWLPLPLRPRNAAGDCWTRPIFTAQESPCSRARSRNCAIGITSPRWWCPIRFWPKASAVVRRPRCSE